VAERAFPDNNGLSRPGIFVILLAMRINTRIGLLPFVLLACPGASFADNNSPLDCGKRSLASAVADAETGRTIVFTGVCHGPIVIRTDGITLKGAGSAVIDGGGHDAVTVAGAHGVSLVDIEIRNGVSGVTGSNGAHIALTRVNVHDNAVFGITLRNGSGALLTDVNTSNNGVHGLDIETGSAVTVTGTLMSANNRVFGINVNGSSITFSRATVNANRNALGIQIATNANAFLNDSATVINTSNNQATGLTVVSGGHLVSFGGTINSSGNPVDGVSVNSKGGLDLDAGSTLNSFGNGNGVVIQEASVMTVFNIPQFSGVQALSTVNSHNNAQAGVSVLTGSTLTLSNQAQIMSTANTGGGLLADNGAGVTLVNSTITGNTPKDVQLTFGTRADVRTTTFGSYSCDATVLVRGSSGINCPH
jgi:hypothetical protein